MSGGKDVTDKEAGELYKSLDREAEASGYHLNPDREFVLGLMRGLLTNEKRYGYMACPCRLAEGNKENDLDIICPCDYRDPDLEEFGTCFCALYVTQEVLDGKKVVDAIPDRREVARDASKDSEKRSGSRLDLSFPVWRCRVCGYLCARDTPPQVCPICKAKKDRFEKFM